MAEDIERWAPGEQITLRYVGHSDGFVKWKPGKLLGWPYVVVEDRPDLLAPLREPFRTHAPR